VAVVNEGSKLGRLEQKKGQAVPAKPETRRKTMIRRSYFYALVIGLLYVSVANAQYPVVDAIANKVAQKYQQSSCEQLWQQRSQRKPPTQQEQEAAQMLRNDAKMRASFVNIVAAPVVNKMIECGMIP
jgi:hypothetical protein